MARHRVRITVEYREPITDELLAIWQEVTARDEGVLAVRVTDASLTDADETRLRGQAAVARGAATPPWPRKDV